MCYSVFSPSLLLFSELVWKNNLSKAQEDEMVWWTVIELEKNTSISFKFQLYLKRYMEVS
jgi:hypothetical protein